MGGPSKWVLLVGTARAPLDSETSAACAAIGAALAAAGFGLCTGGGAGADTAVARAFREAHGFTAGDERLRQVLVEVVVPGWPQAQHGGTAWRRGGSDEPSLMDHVDAMILVGGADGAWGKADEARAAGVPVLPVPATGGAAAKVHQGLASEGFAPAAYGDLDRANLAQALVGDGLPALATRLMALIARLPVRHRATLPPGGSETGAEQPKVVPVHPPGFYDGNPNIVLFFGANPAGAGPAAVAGEFSEVQRALYVARYRACLRLESGLDALFDDLPSKLNFHHPRIVHFSGHGSPRGEILINTGAGGMKAIGSDVLVPLLTPFARLVRLVVLDCCFSAPLAQSLANVVGCAVGSPGPTSDKAVGVSSFRFYEALASGHSVRGALDQAVLGMKDAGIPLSEHPDIAARQGVDPAQIYFVSDGERIP